jgi:hypothetical protein
VFSAPVSPPVLGDRKYKLLRSGHAVPFFKIRPHKTTGQDAGRFYQFYLTWPVSIAISLVEMTLKKQKAKFEHIGSIIADVLKTYRRESDAELVKVWQVWDEIVGDVIAANARPAAFKGKILLVHVSSSTWIHELQFLKKEMIAKLNDTLGKASIHDLKFKIGPL